VTVGRDDSEPAPSAEILERLETTLSHSRVLAGRPHDVLPLTGGLTNFNFKVTTPEQTVVVRLSSSDGDLLAIDREAEHRNSLRAAGSGAAPAVIDYLPDDHALVVAWVEGRTLEADDLRDEQMLGRVASVCRTLHAGPRFVSDFDMVAVQRRYLDIVQDRGYRMPEDYLDFLPLVDRIAAALAIRAGPSVPCNNDLLAANFIDDGDRLWVIDYEYGGNNDACFELGNIWQESELSLAHLEALVDAYFGEHLRHQVARAHLLGVLARYGWTLWAAIQAEVSPIEFDFWSWGMSKYDQARAELGGPAFDDLLAEAVRRD
jgi:thiamine kinase-like enzyme